MRPSPTAWLRRGAAAARCCTVDRGSAVLESAIGIAALVGVGAALIWATGLGICAAQSAFTAREAARSLARGEDQHAVLAQAERSSTGSLVMIDGDAATVTVTVERDFTPGGLLHGLAVTIRQSATAWREG